MLQTLTNPPALAVYATVCLGLLAWAYGAYRRAAARRATTNRCNKVMLHVAYQQANSANHATLAQANNSK